MRDGKAVIKVWGDNAQTLDVTEGAAEGDLLTLSVWSAAEAGERPLKVGSVTDLLSGSSGGTELRYKTDAVWVALVAEGKEIPAAFSLSQNYPNPFNPTTIIKYGLPRDAQVSLEVYNVLGQRVAVLVNAMEKAGYQQVVFKVNGLASGVYFYRLRAGEFTATKRMMIVR